MWSDGLLGIGAFAVLSGLSFGALRHYDEIVLLQPRTVDSSTGYRRYHLDQLPRARLIRALRAVDLPLPELRSLLDADDPGLEAGLRLHRDRLLVEAEQMATHLAILEDIGAGAPGTANFGLLVTDLGAAHRRVTAAGGIEVLPPHDAPGMPRTSTIEDPDGNRVNLYQDA
ncbi:MAG TPA: MerR family transcriptional regulator [Acidimicrobiales bacterium]